MLFISGQILYITFLVGMFLLGLLLNYMCSGDTVVRVKQGYLEGSKLTLRNGKVVTRFTNVPYALPPVGERRFKDPEPIKYWPGVWNATSDKGLKCMQYRHVPGGGNVAGGQEDCLYLFIYTPWLPDKKQLLSDHKLMDVIVYIHGGAFMFGGGSMYQPLSLLEDHDVVFVSLNYRLGPLGFLSTGDDVVPGNMGLKDQTQALQWIQENIAQFGGSPDSVTITGTSAGGASVHFHLLSPKPRGLFHRAISMSGTMLSPWTIAEQLPNKTKLIAQHLGCPVTCNEAIVDCLRSRPALMIAEAVRLTQPFLYNPFSPWGPTVDGFSNDPVLPDYPAELIKQGRVVNVPWLNSVTTAEGLYPGAEFLGSDTFMKTIDENWIKLAPHILDFNFTVADNLKQEVAAKIRYQYMNNTPISRANHKPFIQIISDRMFNVDAERSSRFHSELKLKSHPVYFYEFNFRGRYSLSDAFSRSFTNYGVAHADDTNYVLQFNPEVLLNTTVEEQNMLNFMGTLWTTFARTGKPSIGPWTPVSPNAFNYLRIESAHEYSMKCNVPEIGSRSFWDSLPFDEKNVWTARYPIKDLDKSDGLNYISDSEYECKEFSSVQTNRTL
uniref:Carboxylic ester hydrolase n=1 Tax=Cacopsylla melanoneura TaxID=428564 RepID=A0A8D8QWX7_9HEMI